MESGNCAAESGGEPRSNGFRLCSSTKPSGALITEIELGRTGLQEWLVLPELLEHSRVEFVNAVRRELGSSKEQLLRVIGRPDPSDPPGSKILMTISERTSLIKAHDEPPLDPQATNERGLTLTCGPP